MKDRRQPALNTVALHDFLPKDRFDRLLERVYKLFDGERIHIPAHKRGATVAYQTLRQLAPELLGLYVWMRQVS
jgi:hypothetical protein